MEQKGMEADFVDRTLQILKDYNGPYGVTLLVNCLLGLIILPKEKDFNHISSPDGIDFYDLGIDEKCEIRSWGKIAGEDRTAARFLRCMRNSVAHIKIESLTHEGEIESLRFSDDSGFEAVFTIHRLKEMLFKLARYIH